MVAGKAELQQGNTELQQDSDDVLAAGEGAADAPANYRMCNTVAAILSAAQSSQEEAAEATETGTLYLQRNEAVSASCITVERCVKRNLLIGQERPAQLLSCAGGVATGARAAMYEGSADEGKERLGAFAIDEEPACKGVARVHDVAMLRDDAAFASQVGAGNVCEQKVDAPEEVNAEGEHEEGGMEEGEMEKGEMKEEEKEESEMDEGEKEGQGQEDGQKREGQKRKDEQEQGAMGQCRGATGEVGSRTLVETELDAFVKDRAAAEAAGGDVWVCVLYAPYHTVYTLHSLPHPTPSTCCIPFAYTPYALLSRLH